MKCILLLALLSTVGANFGDFDVDDYKQVTKSRNFTGKVVVVTGSSEGIGRSIIALFSILGAHVVVTGRNETVVKAVAKEMQHLSPYHLEVYFGHSFTRMS